MLQTALEYAFGKAGGLNRNEARFTVAIAEFLNNGGTIERAQDLLDDAAQRLAREGHWKCVENDQVRYADARQTELPSEGQHASAGNGHVHIGHQALHRRVAGQSPFADKAKNWAPASSPPDIAETVAAIRYWHRMRVFHMEQRKRSNLSLGAFLRIALGWSRSLPADESAAVKAKAQALIANGEAEAKGKPFTSDDTYQEWRDTILASIASRGPHDAVEARATKEMERLAASLPVWAAFGEGVRGFGARSLAVIIGEAGDLSAYPKKGHLWKRMGLAVIDGVRQGGLKKSASAEDWIEHGYNRQRRSRMFVIGDCLVKSGDRYRQVYLRRKDYERVKAETAGLTVAPAAKIPAKRKAEFVADGVIHRRAQRYMEKMLLRDLWAAWRRASFTLPERATPDMPAADNSEAKANARVPIMASADLSSPRSPQQEMCA